MSNWQGIAFNQVPDSENQIHGDEVAKRFGFKGGLVPGVTVSAYLLHPVTELFGKAYLERGLSNCRVNSPLYDEEKFEVEITDLGDSHCHTCLKREKDEFLAVAEVKIPETAPAPPLFRGDAISSKPVGLAATRENMEGLMRTGCYAFKYHWDEDHAMSSYLRDRSEMANLYAVDGFANPSYILGVSNWVLASNIAMNPWVHLETRAQNFAALPSGTAIIGEMLVKDVFEKKGHQFVDSEINVFDTDSHQCFSAIKLRAIYRLRGA